jgi:hypothetical protein
MLDKTKEKYRKHIEDYILNYNTNYLEEAYGDGYDEVSKVFKKAMMDVFYYGFSLGLEEGIVFNSEKDYKKIVLTKKNE